MEQLGVGPGRLVGEALAFLLEIRLDEGVIGRDAGDASASAPGTPRQRNYGRASCATT